MVRRGIALAFLGEFARYRVPCAVLVLLIVSRAVLDLVVSGKNIVVFIGKCAMLHDVAKNSLLFFFTWELVYNVAVCVDDISVFGIGRYDEWA